MQARNLNPSTRGHLGWVGLGNFGFPIALNLYKRGYQIACPWIPGHGKTARHSFYKQTGSARSPDTVKDLDALLLCLPTSKDVDEVLQFLGPKLPALVVDLSTVDGNDTARRADGLAAKGIQFIDAPMSGSIESAALGQLTAYCGIEKQCHPFFDGLIAQIASNRFYFNSRGQGNQAKLVNQMMHLGIMNLIADACMLVKGIGLPLDTSLTALRRSSGNSVMLERFGDQIIGGDFAPRFSLALATKDMRLVETLLRFLGLRSEAHEAAVRSFESALDAGFGEKNFSAICQFRMGHLPQ